MVKRRKRKRGEEVWKARLPVLTSDYDAGRVTDLTLSVPSDARVIPDVLALDGRDPELGAVVEYSYGRRGLDRIRVLVPKNLGCRRALRLAVQYYRIAHVHVDHLLRRDAKLWRRYENQPIVFILPRHSWNWKQIASEKKWNVIFPCAESPDRKCGFRLAIRSCRSSSRKMETRLILQVLSSTRNSRRARVRKKERKKEKKEGRKEESSQPSGYRERIPVLVSSIRIDNRKDTSKEKGVWRRKTKGGEDSLEARRRVNDSKSTKSSVFGRVVLLCLTPLANP